MNRKFKELAEAAGFKTDMLPGGFPNESLLTLQDFYESIVKECIDNFDFRYHCGLSGDQCYDVCRAIARHFGIKE